MYRFRHPNHTPTPQEAIAIISVAVIVVAICAALFWIGA